MTQTVKTRLGALVAVVVGVIFWSAGSISSNNLRAKEIEADIIQGRRASGEALAATLGGFRGLAADFLWLRTIRLKDEGRYSEISLLCNLILDMQPRFPEVWNFLAWNFAYNMAFSANDPSERWRWINKGINLLEEGVERNTTSWEIPWELGTTHFFRLGRRGFDIHYNIYQEKLAPVPDWCRENFKFTKNGLWSDHSKRYRIYTASLNKGAHTLGAASAGGGHHTRALRNYFVVVSPKGALKSARVIGGDNPRALNINTLQDGTALYDDSETNGNGQKEHATSGMFQETYTWETPQVGIPNEMLGGALVVLPNSERNLTTEEYLELELATGAKVFTCWEPDTTRNYEIALKWMDLALTKHNVPRHRIARMRAQTLMELGRMQDAYEGFLTILKETSVHDNFTRDAFRNLLRRTVFMAYKRGDLKDVKKWHERLRAFDSSYTMSASSVALSIAEDMTLVVPKLLKEDKLLEEKKKGR